MKKEPVDENELPEDNPISAMMALKHPETVKAVEDATINEMAQGYKSAANRYVGIEWIAWSVCILDKANSITLSIELSF